MDQLCEYGVVGEEEGTKPQQAMVRIGDAQPLDVLLFHTEEGIPQWRCRLSHK